MLFLYVSVLLVLAGGIYSTPVQRKFSFQVPLEFQVISACVRQSAVINCKTNDPSAHVTLVKEGSSVPDSKITRNGATFTIHNLVLHDAGRYHCIANRNGQVINKTILLYPDATKPAIDIIPFEAKRVVNGSTVVYSCIGTYDISWRKVGGSFPMVGVTINSSNMYINNAWRFRKDLVFTKTDFSHAGVYECKLTKSCFGNTPLWKSVILHVSAPKAARIEDVMVACNITGSPIPKRWKHDRKLIENSRVHVHNKDVCGKNVTQSADVKFVCNIAGIPKPEITWKKDGKLLEKSNKFLIKRNSLKIVSPRSPGDEGVFSCEARNDFGVDRMSFDIIPAPPILIKPHSVEMSWRRYQNKPVYIPCALKGSTAENITFQWEVQMCFYSHCYIIQTLSMFKVVDERSKSTLIVSFNYFPPAQYFKFICTARNDFLDEDQLTFYLYKTK